MRGMSGRRSFKVVFVLGLLSGACGAEDPLTEENIASVQQHVDLPTFVNISASGEGTAIAECPSATTHVMGAGANFTSSAGYRRIYTTGPTFCPLPPCTPLGYTVEVQRPNNTGRVWAMATCSDTDADQFSVQESDGDAKVTCPADHVAVGGGGRCLNTSAKLFRSRPNPDTDESRPTGWRASCTSGTVITQVNCVHEDALNDFTGCYTKRMDDDAAGVTISCEPDEFAVSAGAYCGDGSYIDYLNMWNEDAAIGCRSNNTHGYAICCPVD